MDGCRDPAITTEHVVSNRAGLPGHPAFFSQPQNYAPHICQFRPQNTLQGCAQTLFTTLLPGLPGYPANTLFRYGGSAWQISGGVAELVGGGTWDQLWNQYIAEPCGIEVARYGNPLSAAASWDGNPDSLVRAENPSIEEGMISTDRGYTYQALQFIGSIPNAG
ncbi:MAG: serine hydrolase [Haliea sp.]|nr:serine hydrolase [Haliea sp.]